MHFWKIHIGKRTLKASVTGLLLAIIFFFNSESFAILVRNTLLFTALIGLMTVLTENLNSWSKIIIVWTVVLAIPLTALLMTSSSICTMDAIPEYDIARNPLTGEVEQRSNPSTCDTVSFPWYYQSLNSSEAEKYCQENLSKKYCEWKDTKLGKRMRGR